MSGNEPPISGSLGGGDFPTDPPGAYRNEGGGFDVNARIMRGHEALVRQLGQLHEKYQTVVKDLQAVKKELVEVGQLDFGLKGGKGASYNQGAPVGDKVYADQADTGNTEGAGSGSGNGGVRRKQQQSHPERKGNGGWGERLRTPMAIGGAAVGAAGFWYNRNLDPALQNEVMQRYAATGGMSAQSYTSRMHQSMERHGGDLTTQVQYRNTLRGAGIIPGTNLSNRLSDEAAQFQGQFPDRAPEEIAGMLAQFQTGPAAISMSRRGIRNSANQSTSSLIQGSIRQAWGGRMPTLDQLREITPGTMQYQYLTELFGNEQMTQFAVQQQIASRTPGGISGLQSTGAGVAHDQAGQRGQRQLAEQQGVIDAYKSQQKIIGNVNNAFEDLLERIPILDDALARLGSLGQGLVDIAQSPLGLLGSYLLGSGSTRGGGGGRGSGGGSPKSSGGVRRSSTPGRRVGPAKTSTRPSTNIAGKIAGGLGMVFGALGLGSVANESAAAGQRQSLGRQGVSQFLRIPGTSGRGPLDRPDYYIEDTPENRRLIENANSFDELRQNVSGGGKGPLFGGTGGNSLLLGGSIPEGSSVSDASIGDGIGDRPSSSAMLMTRTNKDASHITGLHPELRNRLAAMFRANPRLQINSGYRSAAHQQRLWEEALAQYGDPEIADDWVARPGGSNHQKGLAVDIGPKSEYDWLKRHAPQYGLEPYSKEPWHWELAGTRSGDFEEWSPSEGAGSALGVRGGDGASAPGTTRSLLSLADFSQGSASSILDALGQRGGGSPAQGAASHGVGGGVGVAGGAGGGGGAAVSGSLETFMAAIRRLESGAYGGDYDARGPTVRSGQYAGEQAYGAYQIIPGNWAGWSKAAGVGGAPMSSRTAQDKVASHMFQQYYQQFGSWDATAIAWFAGPSRAKAFQQGADLGGVSDVTGTSVPDYVRLLRKYMGEYGGGGGVGDRPRTASSSAASPTIISGGGGARAVTVNLKLEKTTEAEARRFARRVKELLEEENRRDMIGAS